MNAPPEIGGWNWGAFWLGPIWASGNRVRGPFFWWMVLTVGSIPFWILLTVSEETYNLPTKFIELLFGLSVLMTVAHLFVYPVATLCLADKGNQRAWENGHWRSISEFKRVQRRWAIVGWLLGIPLTLVQYLGVCSFLFLFFFNTFVVYSR